MEWTLGLSYVDKMVPLCDDGTTAGATVMVDRLLLHVDNGASDQPVGSPQTTIVVEIPLL